MATTVKVTNNHFEYLGKRYHRGGADDVQMCTFGKMKDPLGPGSEIAVEAHVFPTILEGKVSRGKPISIDWNRVTKADLGLGGSLRVFVLNAQAAVSLSHKEVKAGRLELVKFSIAEAPLKKMLNTEAGRARNFLADEGADGRIVPVLWAALSGELAEHFRTSGTATTSRGVSGGGIEASLQLTAEGGRYGSQTIELTKGASFAYLPYKVTRWNKGKTQIEDMKEDQHRPL